MNLFLEQTSVVQKLIENVVKSLDYIHDNEAKSKLIDSLQPFYYSIVPTTIDIHEIKSMAEKYNVSLSHIKALEILESVSLDLDLNCVEDSMKYHFDEFLCE